MTPRKETKDQRYYRKQEKDGEKDFRRTTRKDGSEGVRVTRRSISVRVTQEAADKLKMLADSEELTQWEMLSRILIAKTPAYNSLGGSETNRYYWPANLLDPKETRSNTKGRQVKSKSICASRALLETDFNTTAQPQSFQRHASFNL